MSVIPQHKRRFRRRTAFTLLELLVVIGIIGILAALLLPVLAKVKERGKRVACLSRIKQWGFAFRAYADEHDDNCPREGYLPYGETKLDSWVKVHGGPLGNGHTDSEDVWYNALAEYLPGVSAASKYYDYDQRHQFYERNSMFQCPSARFPRDVYNPYYTYALFSIAMNSQLIEWPNIPTIKFSQIENNDPTRMVLFAENRLKGESKINPQQDNSNMGQSATCPYRFVARHAKGGNLGFGDGHVEWFEGTRVVAPHGRVSPISPSPDILWIPRWF